MLLNKKIICLAIMVGLLWGPGAAQARAAAAGVHWQSYAQALVRQKATGKTVMLYFSIPYCYRCKKMEHGAYKSPQVLSLIKKDFIAALVDVAVALDKQVGKDYGVDYTPTHIFIDADGRKVYRVVCVVGSERFLKMLEFVAGGAYRTMSFDQYEQTH